MCSACEALEFLLGDVSRVPIKNAVVIGSELILYCLFVVLVEMSSRSKPTRRKCREANVVENMKKEGGGETCAGKVRGGGGDN